MWDAEYDLDTTPLAAIPDWLLAMLRQPQSQALVADDAPIVDGARSNTLSTMAFHMRKAGMGLEEILIALVAVNGRCEPPLDQTELEGIVNGKRDIHPDPVFTFHPNGTTASTPTSPTSSWPEPTPWDAIATTQYPLRQWLIKDLIPHGLTIIGGAPKAAKSYIAHDIALATAGQGLALGYWGCTPGPVLYCAVEDDPADSKERIHELRPQIPQVVPSLQFTHMDTVPTFSQGLYDYIRHQVTTHGFTLVIIDPLMYVYDLAIPRGKDPFQAMQQALLPFRQLAIEQHFALLFVDHRRKSSQHDLDIFETLYGSRAKEAIADALLMVERDDHDIRISTKGRRIDQHVFHFSFQYHETDHTFAWSFTGIDTAVLSGTRQRMILQAFANAHAAGQVELDARGVIDFAEDQYFDNVTLA
jgi:hypothetical protein